MTNITFEKLSRTAATGNPPQSGSGEGRTQLQSSPHAATSCPRPGSTAQNCENPYCLRRALDYPLPAGSLLKTPFESLDLAQARLHRALMIALPISLLLWGLIGAAAWFLFSVFL
jgi:hypothetical protein